MTSHQPQQELLDIVRAYRRSHEREIVDELIHFLSIPNIETDRHTMQRNAEMLRTMMEKRGLTVRMFDTPTNPIVWGELNVPGATQTLTFYSHYDGVPVEPSRWTDSEPFTPVFRRSKLSAGSTEPKPEPLPEAGVPLDEEARIYARSASDDKGPVIAMFAALDALLDSGLPLKNNLRFVFEGEEESGSRHFPGFVREHRDLIKSDAFFICDGPAYYSGVPTLWFGVRGTAFAHVTVYGANVVLHAGHFTNFAPNPAERLMHLLSSMTDANGKVTFEGFYDNVEPLGETELRALKAAPQVEAMLSDLYGFHSSARKAEDYLESLQQPGFNVAGVQSGWVDSEARYVVPQSATASIMLLPVKGTDPDRMVAQMKAHISGQGYQVVSEDPDHETRMKYPLIAKVTCDWGEPASRTSMDLPISRRIMEALDQKSGHSALFIPSMGSTIGIFSVLHQELGIPTILVSTVNPDNFQHGPNENLRIGNLWTGIETFAALMMLES